MRTRETIVGRQGASIVVCCETGGANWSGVTQPCGSIDGSVADDQPIAWIGRYDGRMQPDRAPSDAAIVIFGAAVRPDGTPSETLRLRVEAAARFARRCPSPRFIPTGAKGRYGDAEATVMARLLIEAGFAPHTIRSETTGTDTLSSVRAVARMLGGNSAVYACTSGYHLPRCLLLLRLAGIKAQACPPPPVPPATSLWSRWYWRLREMPALPFDALLMIGLRATGRD